MYRIAVFQISQETMLAAPGHIDLETSLLWRGDAMFRERLFHMRGVLDRPREDTEVEIVPIMALRRRATPVFSREQFEGVMDELLRRIAEAGRLDGIVAGNHGAMEVEGSDTTADTEIMRRVRALVGPDMPITTGLDMHGHVTPELLRTPALSLPKIGHGCWANRQLRLST